ncbi:MAG: hypothetical protein EA392_07140 [Cryomorphaceae bacterium]|nr:MAG: hypothetical protein EA392_07140 [Cryomorphaceae bacterium]
MHPTLRFVLAVLAALVAGGVVAGLVEAAGHFFYPPPEEITSDEICAYLSTAPAMVFVFPLMAWGVGAFVAGMMAKWFCRYSNKPAFIAGAIMLLMVLLNFFTIPCHPFWMQIAGVLLPVPMAMLGSRLIPTH